MLAPRINQESGNSNEFCSVNVILDSTSDVKVTHKV